MKIDSEHEDYASILSAWSASKGELFRWDDLMWRVFRDGESVFFVSLPRDVPDTYNFDGKWSKYYGPNGVPDET